jgi:peptidyl-prolyl cis-trans isomerase B (cyclophilin B)
MKKNAKYILITVILIFTLVLSACGQKTSSNGETGSNPSPSELPNPIVTIEMESGDIMKVELYPVTAPNTVNNFVSLVKQGFYDGVIFHRVIPGFMIQGGDPDGLGTGGPGYGITGEFAANNFENNLIHEKGVISMARSQHPDSAGSQFFLMHEVSPHLDGQYAAFGKVIEGTDIIDKIATTPTGAQDRPVEEQKMKKVTVETFGVDYPEPEIIQ